MHVRPRVDCAPGCIYDGYTFIHNSISTSSHFAVAVHILILFANAEGPAPSSLIAGSVRINPALIRRLVTQLTGVDSVTSQMGVIGGATLVQPVDRIMPLDIFRVVETPVLVALLPNVSNPAREVSREITGVFRRVTEHAQATLEVKPAAQITVSILNEVGYAQRRRRRA